MKTNPSEMLQNSIILNRSLGHIFYAPALQAKSFKIVISALIDKHT